MARVFSWKLDDYKYGYIQPPNGNNGSHISDRITNDGILSQMAETVKTWDIDTYKTMFNELNEEIKNQFGTVIPGNAEDYFDDGQTNKNYIVLTGKDGSNSNSSGIKEQDLAAIENAVMSKINLAMSEINSIKNNLQTWVNDKTNSFISSANSISHDTIVAVSAMNQSLKEKLDNAEHSLSVASALFDFDNSGVNKQNLISAINKSNSAMTWAEASKIKESAMTQQISQIESTLASVQSEQNNLSSRIASTNDALMNNLGSLNRKIINLETDVVEIKEETSSSQQASAQQEVFSSSKRKSSTKSNTSTESVSTKIIENKDGTYTTLVKVGNESYSINVYGFGSTFDDENKKEGLSLANNGFMYENNGSFISIVDGTIKLMNKNGNGIEITNDGVFINGKKSK